MSFYNAKCIKQKNAIQAIRLYLYRVVGLFSFFDPRHPNLYASLRIYYEFYKVKMYICNIIYDYEHQKDNKGLDASHRYGDGSIHLSFISCDA